MKRFAAFETLTFLNKKFNYYKMRNFQTGIHFHITDIITNNRIFSFPPQFSFPGVKGDSHLSAKIQLIFPHRYCWPSSPSAEQKQTENNWVSSSFRVMSFTLHESSSELQTKLLAAEHCSLAEGLSSTFLAQVDDAGAQESPPDGRASGCERFQIILQD